MPAVLGETVKLGTPLLVQIRPSFSLFAEIGYDFALEGSGKGRFFAARRAAERALTAGLPILRTAEIGRGIPPGVSASNPHAAKSMILARAGREAGQWIAATY
jgi:hypothetical protein